MCALTHVDDTPTPVPISMRDMIFDPNTTEERAPGALISKPSDLSVDEKCVVTQGVLQAWCKDHRGGSEPLVMTANIRQISQFPSDQETAADEETASDEETVIGQDNGPAYLGLSINPDDRSITWLFKGEEGPIDPSMIDYNLYEDKASAYAACISNYDANEIGRIESYNREYLLTQARRHVVRFSTTSTQPLGLIHLGGLPTKVETIVLASAIVNENIAFLSTVAASGQLICRIEDDF
ncbi:hypothetical protein NCS52_00242100 [Fusarium sp. LHS14.1]|nr:hypothetical protein NCS52_00242100 [Fusarium sp. LHS14.1]